MSPTILLNITHGFQARMLLRSSIAEGLLSAGARLVVVSPNADEDYFRREMECPGVTLEMMPNGLGRLEAELIILRQYLLMNPSLGATLNYKNEAFRTQHPLRYRAARAGNAVIGRIPPIRKQYLRLESALFSGREFDALLDRHCPDLVITGTPGINIHDMHLIRAARRQRIPTATVMLSWDNLTSKGYMGAVPDHLLVWSELMAQEALHYHGFSRERTTWVGAAQFDHYHGFRAKFDREAWRRAHGLSLQAPLIVYGTINPTILPHEARVVAALLKALQAAPGPLCPHLWVRLHPQVIRGGFQECIEAFRALAGHDVTVEEPRVRSEILAWDLPREDATHLAGLLAAADVVATPSSTLVIDAACVGTPIVNVLFDGDELVQESQSAARFAHYTHYAKILETGGIALARTPEEFVARVAEYLRDPGKDLEGRDRIIAQQLGVLDGHAGSRIARALLSLIARHKGTA